MKYSLALILLSAISFTACQSTNGHTLGDLSAKRTTGVIKVDGNLDEGDWKTTGSTGALQGHFGADETSPRFKAHGTEVKVLWDENHLYLAFICRASSYLCTKTKHDDKLYHQEVAEAFLDFKGDMLRIAELQMNPKGATGDYYHRWEKAPTYPANKIDWEERKKHHSGTWDWTLPGFESKASDILVEGKLKGYTIEAKIPVESVLERAKLGWKLRPYQVIRANFLRYTGHTPRPNGKGHSFLQYNWGRTVHGCPHVSPMAMRPIVLVP